MEMDEWRADDLHETGLPMNRRMPTKAKRIMSLWGSHRMENGTMSVPATRSGR